MEWSFSEGTSEERVQVVRDCVREFTFHRVFEAAERWHVFPRCPHVDPSISPSQRPHSRTCRHTCGTLWNPDTSTGAACLDTRDHQLTDCSGVFDGWIKKKKKMNCQSQSDWAHNPFTNSVNTRSFLWRYNTSSANWLPDRNSSTSPGLSPSALPSARHREP